MGGRRYFSTVSSFLLKFEEFIRIGRAHFAHILMCTPILDFSPVAYDGTFYFSPALSFSGTHVEIAVARIPIGFQSIAGSPFDRQFIFFSLNKFGAAEKEESR